MAYFIKLYSLLLFLNQDFSSTTLLFFSSIYFFLFASRYFALSTLAWICVSPLFCFLFQLSFLFVMLVCFIVCFCFISTTHSAPDINYRNAFQSWF